MKYDEIVSWYYQLQNVNSQFNCRFARRWKVLEHAINLLMNSGRVMLLTNEKLMIQTE